MSRILVATTNRGKLREFARLLSPLDAEVVDLIDIGLELDVAEPHQTYRENAIEKARAYCRASGLLTLADDSGIEVAALGWGPGVNTAHWGRQDGRDPQRMSDMLVAATDRRARMVCWLAVAVPQGDRDPAVETFSGVVEGSIATEPRGSAGFGFDPIFLLDGGRTTAELPEGDKDRVSHRGRAVVAALPRLAALVGSREVPGPP